MSISSRTRFTTLKAAAAALLLATASVPAYAGGYHGGGYHGGYYHGGYYHGGCCSSSAGWWIGGALALGVAGAVIAANSQPTYYGPPVVYSAPVYPAPVYAAPYPVYPAPAYAAPAPVYAAPPSPYVPPAPSGLIAYPARGQSQAQQNRDRAECEHWASGQSGMDPATMTKYTTGVSVDSYNRAMSACMTGRGYSVS